MTRILMVGISAFLSFSNNALASTPSNPNPGPIVAFLLVGSLLVGLYAKSKNRSFLFWFIVSFMITPMISGVLVFASRSLKSNTSTTTNDLTLDDLRASEPSGQRQRSPGVTMLAEYYIADGLKYLSEKMDAGELDLNSALAEVDRIFENCRKCHAKMPPNWESEARQSIKKQYFAKYGEAKNVA